MRGRGTGAGRGGVVRAVVRVAVGGVVGAVLVLVGGCTGDDGPPTRPTSTVTSSPTPTSDPTPTPMALPTPPTVMAEPTTDGAIAAGTHFVALYDYAFSSGDAGPLMAMSAEGCEYCATVRDQVQEMVDGGYSTEADPLRVVLSDSTEIREDEWFRVQLRVEQGEVTTVAADGARDVTSAGGVVDFVFAISWIGDGWRVEAVDLAEVPS